MQSETQHKKIAALAAAVYFIQGALGISAVAMPVFFRRLGWSVAEITVLSSLASLPWVFKIIYGFLSDSFPLFGFRRKSYLFFYLIFSAAGWLALSTGMTEKRLILAALIIANLGYAGTDVITDGLIVEHSEGQWSRIFQSIAWGFRSLGAVLTGMLGGWLALKVTPQTLFAATALLPLAVIPGIWALHEIPYGKQRSPGALLGQAKLILQFCFSRSTLFFFLFFTACTASSLFGTPFFFFMKEKLFFAEDYLGFLISLGWAGAIAGSLIYARFFKSASMKKVFSAVVVINTLNIVSTWGVREVYSAAALIFLGGIAAGMILTPLMAGAAEAAAKSGVEGTLFAVLTSVFNLTQIGWGIAGGKLSAHWSVDVLIGASAAIQLLGFFCIPYLDFNIKSGPSNGRN